MKNTLLLLAAVLFFGSSCSNVFENENDSVDARFSSEYLVISNGLNEAVYYAVFEQGSLAFTDWIPLSTKENRLNPDETIRLKKDDIHFYKEGRKVVVFYWTDTNVDSAYNSMEHVVIE